MVIITVDWGAPLEIDDGCSLTPEPTVTFAASLSALEIKYVDVVVAVASRDRGTVVAALHVDSDVVSAVADVTVRRLLVPMVASMLPKPPPPKPTLMVTSS